MGMAKKLSQEETVAVLRTVPLATFCVNQKGDLVFANEAGLALVGRSAPASGESIKDIFPEWTDTDCSSSEPLLTFAKHGDGTVIPVEISVARVSAGQNGLTALYARDVDAQSRRTNHLVTALEQAHVAERRLREIIEMLPEGVCVFDAEDRYVLWNKKYADIYPEVANVLAVGVPFVDVLRASLGTGLAREQVDDHDLWLEGRLAKHALPFSQEEQELRDGHWLRHDDRRLAEGGAIGMRIDITDLKRREASFRLLFQNNPVPMLVFEPETLRIIDVNEASCRLYGFAREDFLARSAPELHAADEAETAKKTLESVVDAYDGRTIWRQRTAGGDEIHVLIFVRALVHEQRRGLLTAVADVSDRVRAEAKVRYMAHHDSLTGLPNRTQFHETLDAVLTRPGSERRGIAVYYLDLDGFKPVNDTLGHRAGDSLLKLVAARLKSAVRLGDLVARLGGDEFAVIEIDPPNQPSKVAERLTRTLKEPFDIDGHEVTISASVGFVVVPRHAIETNVEELIAAADTALYEAKRAGKNTWRRGSDIGGLKPSSGLRRAGHPFKPRVPG